MFEMICRVFKIAGNSRRKIVAGIVCNILKSFFNGFMMFGVIPKSFIFKWSPFVV